MGTVIPDMVLQRHDASGLYEQRDVILAVYAEVYAARLENTFYSLPRYWERLQAYASRDGFSLVTGWIDDELIGYTMGFTLSASSRWWQGLRSHVEPNLLVETGQRTFAVTEMMVRESWRRRGYARALHDTLLSSRYEDRATLTVRPDNTSTCTAYLSWGWYKLGELQPFADAPVYDVMIRDLAASSPKKQV